MQKLKKLLEFSWRRTSVEAGEFARLIDDNRSAIISVFVDRALKEVPGTKFKNRSYVKDHLPNVLDQLAQFLKRNDYKSYRDSAWLSSKHGLQRAEGEQYTASDLRHEYSILDNVIRSHIPKGRELSKDSSERYGEIFRVSLSHATETFIRNSGVEFVGHRRQQASTELERDTARTERDDARQKLDESTGLHAWLHHAIAHIPVPLFFLNRETQTSWFSNHAAKDFLGFSYEDERLVAIESGRISLSTLDGRRLAGSEFPSARGLRGETVQGEEFKLHTPKGDHIVRVSVEQIAAISDQPASAVLMIHDITESKTSESDLKIKNVQLMEAQRQLSAATQVAKIGFFDWDMQKDIFIVSDQFARDWGVETGVTIGELFELIFAEDRDRTRRFLDRAVASGEHYHAEYRIRRKTDNKILWIEAQGRVTKDANGKPRMFFGTSIDITERKDVESATIAMVNTIPQLAWMGDENGHLFWYNQGWLEFTGASQEEMKTLGWGPFHHPDHLERASKKWFEHLAAGDAWEDIFPLRGKSGEYRTFLSRATPVRDVSGRITRWFGTNTDITDTVRSSEALSEAKAIAEAANLAKSQFLANMSHEIRTPLGAIMGFSDVLLSPSTTPQDIPNYLNVIERNSKHLLRIVDDILDLSKVEAGMLVVEEVSFSLPEILTDFSSLMGLKAREKGIQFDLRYATAIPTKIVSDPTRLRQILNNIVSNAIKFTPRGRVELGVTVENETLIFQVTDTGIGMTDEQAERIFVPFQQADSTTTRRFGGTGLGLVLTRRLTEAMGGGFVLNQTTVDVGTSFTATVKVKITSDAVLVKTATLETSTHTHSSMMNEQSLNGVRILLIEDSPDNQVLISLLLTKVGAKVDLANDGVEGLEAALAKTFDVVLCDMQMPRMDGYQVVTELRAKGYAVPIVALTAHAMKEEYAKAMRAGFTDYLTKPVQRADLIATVGRHARVE